MSGIRARLAAKDIGLGILSAVAWLFLLATAVAAQVPTEERQFVYGVNASTGRDYSSTFYPLTSDTLYLLANTPSIVSSRYTLVYFWPTTNEYRADWDGLNEVVSGTLEILQGGKVIQNLSQTRYVIQYPRGYEGNEVYLYTGEEATAKYQEFVRQRDAYRDRVWQYYEADMQYQQQLETLIARQKQGEQVTIPEPPAEPEAFLFLSTNVNDGFPIELAPGVYQIRVKKSDGQWVPESDRKLIAFSHRREGLGYTIVPQAKWTTTERADDPGHVIYARSGTVMYLQPFLEKEYRELYHIRLENPQSNAGSVDRWTWAYTRPKETGYLEVLQGDRVVRRIEKKPYWVKQMPGPALGYEVIEQESWEPGTKRLSPDFEGYRIQVDSSLPAYTIRLVEADGRPVLGSSREVRLVRTDFLSALYLLPLLPLVAGTLLILWRRTRLATFRPSL